MTNEQRALLQADQRRHLALAKSCKEICLREQHEAIAEALGAAIEEGEVKPCKSEIKCVSFRVVSVPIKQSPRSRVRKTRRRGM